MQELRHVSERESIDLAVVKVGVTRMIGASLAAYFGLPQAPTYSASKAALRAYGEALRAWLAPPPGHRGNVVLPRVRANSYD